MSRGAAKCPPQGGEGRLAPYTPLLTVALSLSLSTLPAWPVGEEPGVQHWKKKSRGFQKGNLSDEQVSELRRRT